MAFFDPRLFFFRHPIFTDRHVALVNLRDAGCRAAEAVKCSCFRIRNQHTGYRLRHLQHKGGDRIHICGGNSQGQSRSFLRHTQFRRNKKDDTRCDADPVHWREYNSCRDHIAMIRFAKDAKFRS
jgi:hypothetical protein